MYLFVPTLFHASFLPSVSSPTGSVASLLAGSPIPGVVRNEFMLHSSASLHYMSLLEDH
ncbi:hypothetical protein pphageBV72_01 [Pseudomonas phage pphageBV72]|nr:hypothetical protein pphageBV72_01 [Pseudomonas phage pphageBV72]